MCWATRVRLVHVVFDQIPDLLWSTQYFYECAQSWLINQRDSWLDPEALSFFETMVAGGFRPNAHIDVLPQQRLIYIAVPKCASTTIKSILSTLIGADMASRGRLHRRQYTRLKSPGLLGLSAFHRLATSPATMRFSFVRNPYARLVSAWADKYRNKPLVAGDSFVNQYLAHCTSINPGFPKGPDQTLTFPQFVELATATADRRIDAHWQLQDDLLNMPGIKLDFIGKVESFRNDFVHVLDHVDPDLALRQAIDLHLNASNHQPWSDYYSDALAERVCRAYERDFDRFGYARAVK
jgi:hypothetical protein